jgi:two-component system LytT family sensor kinase
MRLKILLLIACFITFYFLSHGAGWLNTPQKSWNLTVFMIEVIKEFLSPSFFVFLLDNILTYLLFYFLYPNKGIVATLSLYLFVGIPAMIGLRFVVEEIILFHITGHHNYNMKYLTLRSYALDNLYFTVYYNFVAIAFFGAQYERFKKLTEKS